MHSIYRTLLISASITCSLNALTLNNTIKETIKNNTDIMVNNLKTKSKLLNMDIEKSGYYPTVDLNWYLEKSQTKDDDKSWIKKDGHRSTLSLKQLLYDGSNQSSSVDIAKYDYENSKYNTIGKNEEIVMQASKQFLDLFAAQSIKQIAKHSLDEHEKALKIAKDQEEISGQILETKTTESLIGNARDAALTKDENYARAYSKFVNITSLVPNSALCTPTIHNEYIPGSLSQAIEYSLENSSAINEQKSIIKQQKSLLVQATSTYKPIVELKLDASFDNDLVLVEQGNQKELSGQVDLNWNLYNGGKDSGVKEKEKLILLQEQKKLEQIKKNLIEETTVAYKLYEISKKRVLNLNEVLTTEEKILEVTRNQLEDGTKTFLNVLSSQTKIVKTQEQLINQEMKHFENYYSLLKSLSILTKTILADNANQCTEANKIENLIIKKDVPGDDLNNLVSQNEELIEPLPVPVENHNEDLEVFGDSINLDDLTITLPIGTSLFGQGKKSKTSFQSKLDDISTQLLSLLSQHGNSINSVELRAYTSSEYRSKNTQSEKDYANYKLSEKRIKLLKEYLLKKAQMEGFDVNQISRKLISRPMGAKDFIYYSDGSENYEASRRIVIKLLQ